MLPLSTLKRTDAQSVLLNWTQSKVKQTDKQMSDEGGLATNNLPTVEYYKQSSVKKIKKRADIFSVLFVLATNWLI